VKTKGFVELTNDSEKVTAILWTKATSISKWNSVEEIHTLGRC